MRATAALQLVVAVVVAAVVVLDVAKGEEVVMVRGLPPGMQQRPGQTEGAYRCGSGKKVPWKRVNDGYCDCTWSDAVVESSGSNSNVNKKEVVDLLHDEPGTSACSGLTPAGRSFWCAQVGHEPLSLPASRVNDGVCDCCDGADEWENIEKGKSSCPNTCRQSGAASRESRQKELETQKLGLAEQTRLTRLATEQRAELEEQVAALKAEKGTVESHKAQAEADRNAAKKEEDDTRTRLIAERLLRDPSVATPEKKDEEKIEIDESAFDDDDDEDKDDAAVAASPPAETVEEAHVEPEQPVVDPIPDSVHDASKKIVDDLAEISRTRQTALDDFDRKLRDLETTIANGEKALVRDFGPGNMYFSIRDECYSVESKEYTYELCLFNKVQQGSTSLGTWKDDDNKTPFSGADWRFTGGLKCWGGPDRSAIISMQCGSEFSLSDPNEPNRCEYHMKFATPAACSPQRITELEEMLAEDSKASSSGVHDIKWI